MQALPLPKILPTYEAQIVRFGNRGRKTDGKDVKNWLFNFRTGLLRILLINQEGFSRDSRH